MAECGVDFVMLWVDGEDPAWREAFLEAERKAGRNADGSTIRYRDWDTLHYWFRGVEQFAPWVRKIHLITWGHLPKWLLTEHPKLQIVNHKEYIPEAYLPTFNSNTIELNLHRLEGLAEHFVLFNDDLFLLRPTPLEEFFREGLPRDMARLSLVQASPVGHTIYNNLALIHRCHTRQALNRHLGKWLHPTYGVGNLLKTLTLLPWSFFPGFYDPHQAQPYQKQAFARAWEQWGEALDASCRHPLRELSDLSHWLVRYDTLCRGEFVPRNFNDCLLADLSDTQIESLCEAIRSARYRMVCLNDSPDIADFEQSRRRLQEALETILPQKSSYER